jgi:hypothetical protein
MSEKAYKKPLSLEKKSACAKETAFGKENCKWFNEKKKQNQEKP